MVFGHKDAIFKDNVYLKDHGWSILYSDEKFGYESSLRIYEEQEALFINDDMVSSMVVNTGSIYKSKLYPT